MKSKKIVSMLCVSVLSASAFAALAVNASAAESVLWSDSFNGYKNIVDHNSVATVGQVLVDGTFTAGNTYDGIDGIVLTTTNRGDDSSFYQITEGADGEALTTQVSRFSSAGRGASITFNETYAPASDKDLVLAFKTKTSNLKETTYDTALQINGAGNIDLSSAADWTDVKVVITTSGATAYVGDADRVPLSNVTNLSSIKFDRYDNGVKVESGDTKAASHPLGYPTISIDDVVVYTTDAGNGAASNVPKAEDKNQGEVTYEAQAPVPEKPGKVEKLDLGLAGSDTMSNIANNDKGRLIFLGKEAQEFTDLKTVNLAFPQHSEDRSDTNWKVGVINSDPSLNVTDKYIQASNATDSTANRGARMYFKNSNDVYEIAEREAVVAQFATRLHANGANPAEVVFSGDLVASESKGNLASPLAMITTDAEADSAVYAVNNPLEKGGNNVIQVADNEWVLVTITAYRSEGKTAGAKIAVTTYTDGVANEPVYIFGSADSYGDIKDNTKSGVNNMPYITFRSGNSADYGVSGTKNDIDNIYFYSSLVDPASETAPQHNVEISADNTKVTTTETDAFNAILIHVKYDGTRAVSGQMYRIEGLSSTNEYSIPDGLNLEAGDKLMVWSGAGMVPYCPAKTIQ